MVEAAYAAVDALVNTPYLIIQAVKAVLVGDLSTAVATIVQAIKAFIHPGLVLVGDFGNVFDKYVLPSTNSTPSAGAAATDNTGVAASPATTAGESASDPAASTAELGQCQSPADQARGQPEAGHRVDRPAPLVGQFAGHR